MKRREFLGRMGAVAFGQSMASCFAEEVDKQSIKPILLLVQLAGGNDGLNTLIPYQNPIYRDLRPTLAIGEDRVLKLNDEWGLHPSLKQMLPIWENNNLALITGVGYEKPNRSHFRSIDIWHTASDSEQVLSQGWLSGSFASLRKVRNSPLDAIDLDGRPDPLKGESANTLVMNLPKKFLRTAAKSQMTERKGGNQALRHIENIRQGIRNSAEYLKENLAYNSPLQHQFRCGGLGRQLSVAARMITAGLEIPVYKVSLGGFDTHANQAKRHADKLMELAYGLDDFRTRMVEHQCWEQVVILVYSEFGRRVKENGSLGTDHGTASVSMLLGGRVKGGLYGEAPALDNLDVHGDLQFTMDYRRVYATVLEEGLGVSSAYLPGKSHQPLGIIG